MGGFGAGAIDPSGERELQGVVTCEKETTPHDIKTRSRGTLRNRINCKKKSGGKQKSNSVKNISQTHHHPGRRGHASPVKRLFIIS